MLARPILIGAMALLVSPIAAQAQGLTFRPVPQSGGTVPKLRLELKPQWVDLPVRASGRNGSQARQAPGPLWHAAVWGVVGGVAGFFAGGFIGEKVDKHFGRQNSDGFKGAIIGSISGAELGAFLLAKFGP